MWYQNSPEQIPRTNPELKHIATKYIIHRYLSYITVSHVGNSQSTIYTRFYDLIKSCLSIENLRFKTLFVLKKTELIVSVHVVINNLSLIQNFSLFIY